MAGHGKCNIFVSLFFFGWSGLFILPCFLLVSYLCEDLPFRDISLRDVLPLQNTLLLLLQAAPLLVQDATLFPDVLCLFSELISVFLFDLLCVYKATYIKFPHSSSFFHPSN